MSENKNQISDIKKRLRSIKGGWKSGITGIEQPGDDS